MKTLVLYQSYSGFTAKYATWIAEELNASLLPISKAAKAAVAAYDTIIFGGSLHMTGISGAKFFKTFLPTLSGKRIIVFAVGASPPLEGIPQKILDRNFSAEEQCLFKFFYFRGGFNFQKLDFPNKVLMGLLKLKLQRKKNRTAEEQGMLDAYKVPIDATNKEAIRPLLETVALMLSEAMVTRAAEFPGGALYQPAHR